MCVVGSTSPFFRVCGGDAVFCPAGTVAPIKVGAGFYTADYSDYQLNSVRLPLCLSIVIIISSMKHILDACMISYKWYTDDTRHIDTLSARPISVSLSLERATHYIP